jgi:hypothetical protein
MQNIKGNFNIFEIDLEIIENKLHNNMKIDGYE